jgi:SOS-response transcriptional repressor LexA/DNA-binding XRE family transcriptional regulator
MENLYQFGSRLKQAIKQSPYTQKELADLLHVNQDTMTNYVKGTIPRADVLYRLSQYLGVSMDWLLTGSEGEQVLKQENAAQDDMIGMIMELNEDEKKDLKTFVEFLKYRRVNEKRRPGENFPSGPPKEGDDAEATPETASKEEKVYLPLLGGAAHRSASVYEVLEGYVPVSKKFVDGKTFVVRAKGGSMTGIGINDGDLLVIRRSAVEHGDLSLVRMGDELYVTYFRRNGDRAVLIPVNPRLKSVEGRDARNYFVIGKVIHVIKREERETEIHDFSNR